jgi:branched-chain amino acid transport system permease protein
LSTSIGMMGLINLAHGSIFMVGGFVGVSIALKTGNWILGILAGGAASGVIALLIGEGFLRHLYKQYQQQVLLTFGFVYILLNLADWIWGPLNIMVNKPDFVSGSLTIGSFTFPTYRLLVIGIGMTAFFLLWWLQEKTKYGAIVRAGMDNAEMVAVLGINIRPITVGAFCLGLVVAGMAAVLASPILGGVNVWNAPYILFMALAVAIVGGIGSVQGALVGALLVGIIYVWVATYFPALPTISIYVFMAIILLFRTQGILGRRW